MKTSLPKAEPPHPWKTGAGSPREETAREAPGDAWKGPLTRPVDVSKPPRSNLSAEPIKRFRLVKYLSVSSLIVFLVGTFFLSWFLSHRARAILLKKSEQYALLVAENLNHQVFFEFTLPTLMTEGEIRLSREHQYTRLHRVVQNAIRGFAVQRVNIYDPEQVLTYSTSPDQLGKKMDLGEHFHRALRGESVSILEGPETTFLGFAWRNEAWKLKTYLPMWEERPMSWKRGRVLGVFEITQDISSDYETIHRFQVIIVSSVLIFVSLLFAALLIIGRRAEVILAARTRERLRLEEELHQAERLAALGEMIAGVSHEIRNPLGIIRSTAEILASKAENERQARLAGIVVEEATRLNNIVTQFLDFARPKTLEPAACRIEEIIDRILEGFEPECQKRGIRVERSYQTGQYKLEADANLLYRALMNLVSNATQAMPEGGVLRLESALVMTNSRSEPAVEVRVSDTGAGIPPEIRHKIFNPFFTTREKGTGLGLAIVRTIVDSHCGTLDVESEPGRGTVFVLRLPLRRPRPGECEDEATP
ncbi:MAG: ATP-binding protein [Thermodesulfobacteriota bacterium]|nr:ATP-binding protein [Thermodesulfobacteriota bacterium]